MEQSFSNIIQIGVVVSDAAAVMQNLERILNWRPSGTLETRRIPGRTYHGKAEDFACRMYFYQFSRIELEIIQPLCGKSCWDDFLTSCGNGIHHLLFDLSDSESAFTWLSGCGIETEQRGRALPYGEHVFWAYMNSLEQLGFTIELTNRSEHPQPVAPSVPLQGSFSRLMGVSIAVSNLESTIQAYQSILGWKPVGEPYRIWGDRYLNQESTALSGAALYSHDALALELMRPVCGPSCAHAQIASLGDGAFCLDFGIDTPDELHLLTDQGIAILEQGHTLTEGQMMRWTIFDTKELFGFAIRALYR